MCVPGKDDPNSFHLQVNGEALWQWRNKTSPSQLFEVIQDGLVKIGYRLSQSSRARVGKNVKARLDHIAHKIRGTTDCNARKAMRSKYWCTIALHREEIAQGPADIIDHLKNTEEELLRENQRLEGEKKVQR